MEGEILLQEINYNFDKTADETKNSSAKLSVATGKWHSIHPVVAMHSCRPQNRVERERKHGPHTAFGACQGLRSIEPKRKFTGWDWQAKFYIFITLVVIPYTYFTYNAQLLGTDFSWKVKTRLRDPWSSAADGDFTQSSLTF